MRKAVEELEHVNHYQVRSGSFRVSVLKSCMDYGDGMGTGDGERGRGTGDGDGGRGTGTTGDGLESYKKWMYGLKLTWTRSARRRSRSLSATDARFVFDFGQHHRVVMLMSLFSFVTTVPRGNGIVVVDKWRGQENKNGVPEEPKGAIRKLRGRRPWKNKKSVTN